MKRREPILRGEWEWKGGAMVPPSWFDQFFGVLGLVASLEFRVFFIGRVPMALGALASGLMRRCASMGGPIRPQPVWE